MANSILYQNVCKNCSKKNKFYGNLMKNEQTKAINKFEIDLFLKQVKIEHFCLFPRNLKTMNFRW